MYSCIYPLLTGLQMKHTRRYVWLPWYKAHQHLTPTLRPPLFSPIPHSPNSQVGSESFKNSGDKKCYLAGIELNGKGGATVGSELPSVGYIEQSQHGQQKYWEVVRYYIYVYVDMYIIVND